MACEALEWSVFCLEPGAQGEAYQDVGLRVYGVVVRLCAPDSASSDFGVCDFSPCSRANPSKLTSLVISYKLSAPSSARPACFPLPATTPPNQSVHATTLGLTQTQTDTYEQPIPNPPPTHQPVPGIRGLGAEYAPFPNAPPCEYALA